MIIALLLTLFSVRAEADVAAGIAAYQRSDFVTALQEFQEAATQDDVRALNFLGIMHAEGLGTPRDDKQAAAMFSKAAILGFPEAIANLAIMHATGRGVPQDNNAAVSAYRAAARAGFSPAIIRMAEIYEKGELGETPDAALAREWRAQLQGPSTQPADASPAEPSAPAQNVIETVTVTQQSGRILIQVRTNSPLARPPNSFTVATPPRIVFDFPHTATSLWRSRDVGEGELQSIRVVQSNGRTRLVLNLHNMMQYDAIVNGRNLLITLTPREQPRN